MEMMKKRLMAHLLMGVAVVGLQGYALGASGGVHASDALSNREAPDRSLSESTIEKRMQTIVAHDQEDQTQKAIRKRVDRAIDSVSSDSSDDQQATKDEVEKKETSVTSDLIETVAEQAQYEQPNIIEEEEEEASDGEAETRHSQHEESENVTPVRDSTPSETQRVTQKKEEQQNEQRNGNERGVEQNHEERWVSDQEKDSDVHQKSGSDSEESSDEHLPEENVQGKPVAQDYPEQEKRESESLQRPNLQETVQVNDTTVRSHGEPQQNEQQRDGGNLDSTVTYRSPIANTLSACRRRVFDNGNNQEELRQHQDGSSVSVEDSVQSTTIESGYFPTLSTGSSTSSTGSSDESSDGGVPTMRVFLAGVPVSTDGHQELTKKEKRLVRINEQKPSKGAIKKEKW